MRTLTLTLYLLAACALVVSYNNCSANHRSSASMSSFESCNLILKDEFKRGYHSFLQQNCNSCHTNGGTGNGRFADASIDTAFGDFLVRGNQLVGDRAQDPNHQPPFTGVQHQSEIESLDSSWDVIKLRADQCVIAAGGTGVNDGIGGGIVPEPVFPNQGTILTYIKLIEADKDGTTITWDLSNEIKTPGYAFSNAELSVKVTAITTINGEKSYIISEPKLKAGDQALHFMYMDFVINNELIEDVNSYRNIERRVPAGQTRDLAGGATTFPFDVQSTDTIAISIGKLDPIDFNPPTFDDLISPTGVLGQNCLSCHDSTNARGGFDMSTRALVINQLMVAPYSPNNSEIFKRMNDPSNPMPQSGLLPQSDIDQVLHWIQDGAP